MILRKMLEIIANRQQTLTAPSARLDQVVNDMAHSYTQRLLVAGPKRCGQKVGEEGVEVALAAAAGSPEELVSEAADLIYHLLVTFVSRGVDFERVWQELNSRMPSP
jgi:phosphoribosyl-ATP pyrophosphohydrolase/phosphoribosyl-AMP cyclohydrolase